MTAPLGFGPASQNTLQRLSACLSVFLHLALLQIDIFHIIIVALSLLPRSLGELWLMMLAEDLRRLGENVSCQSQHGLALQKFNKFPGLSLSLSIQCLTEHGATTRPPDSSGHVTVTDTWWTAEKRKARGGGGNKRAQPCKTHNYLNSFTLLLCFRH